MAMTQEPASKRPRQTPILVDAVLASLVVVLATDAVFFLRHGDLHREAWNWRAVDHRHVVTLPLALLGLWVARRLHARPAVAMGVGLMCAWVGILLMPEVSG
ncbi:MAG: hypothetical protein NTW19_12110 [Planctomycetota bacterium]|nr:hypothetical protein [Planctomycetota bacterium]